MPCFACKAEVQVPLDVTITKVTCACGREAPVNRYISDVERLQIDMARQIAGNEELARLKVDGLRCRKCNAHNPVADPIEVQQICSSCRGVILLSDYVPPDAIDRQRLKASVDGIGGRGMAMQAASKRNQVFLIVGLFLAVGAIVAIVRLLG